MAIQKRARRGSTAAMAAGLVFGLVAVLVLAACGSPSGVQDSGAGREPRADAEAPTFISERLPVAFRFYDCTFLRSPCLQESGLEQDFPEFCRRVHGSLHCAGRVHFRMVEGFRTSYTWHEVAVLDFGGAAACDLDRGSRNLGNDNLSATVNYPARGVDRESDDPTRAEWDRQFLSPELMYWRCVVLIRGKDRWQERGDQFYGIPRHWAVLLTPAMVAAVRAAGPEAEEVPGATALHRAALHAADPAEIAALVAAGADSDAAGPYGGTPVHWAALRADGAAVLGALLAAGADPDVRDEFGNTPLHWAVTFNDDPAVIGAELAAGTDPHERGAAASGAGTLAVVEALFGAGADPDARDGDFGETVLHRAAMLNGDPAVLGALAVAADVRAEQIHGATALHLAAAYNENPEITAALLEAGADPRSTMDRRNRTPLHRAAWSNGNPAVLSVLLAAGADLQARDRDELTPLHAAGHNDNPAVLSVLIAAGADLDARAEYDYTPLHTAARYARNPAVLSVLLDAGADPNVQGRFGSRPLHRAAGSNNRPGILAVLMAAGADPSARQEGGWTPLHYAAGEEGIPALVAVLVAAGADVNAQTDDGETPLHDAVKLSRSPEVVEALLDAGADPGITDDQGRVPADYAEGTIPLRGTEALRRLQEGR